MTVNLTLLVVMGVCYGVGVYMLLERSLTRVLLGILLLTNGTNLLILHTGGVPGFAPLYRPGADGSEYSDPLPQALILTAIVIGMATTAFMLSLIYRSWSLARREDVQDDLEDRRVAQQPAWDAEDDRAMPQDESEFTDMDSSSYSSDPDEDPDGEHRRSPWGGPARHRDEEAVEAPGHRVAEASLDSSRAPFAEHQGESSHPDTATPSHRGEGDRA